MKTGRPRKYDHAKIYALRMAGLTVTKVAARVGCSPGYVSQICPTSYRRVGKWPHWEEQELYALVARGHSQTNIASTLERTVGSVAGKIFQLGGARQMREVFYGQRRKATD